MVIIHIWCKKLCVVCTLTVVPDRCWVGTVHIATWKCVESSSGKDYVCIDLARIYNKQSIGYNKKSNKRESQTILTMHHEDALETNINPVYQSSRPLGMSVQIVFSSSKMSPSCSPQVARV